MRIIAGYNYPLEYDVLATNNEFHIVQQVSNGNYYYVTKGTSIRAIQDAQRVAKNMGIADIHNASFVSYTDIAKALKQ